MNKQKEKERTEADEVRSQFTVVLENIETHNRAFGDMLMGVRDDVNILKDKVDNLESRFDGLENRFDGLENRFDGLENRFEGLEALARSTFEEVGRLREDITEMNDKKADKSDLIVLSSRVSRLELAH